MRVVFGMRPCWRAVLSVAVPDAPSGGGSRAGHERVSGVARREVAPRHPTEELERGYVARQSSRRSDSTQARERAAKACRSQGELSGP